MASSCRGRRTLPGRYRISVWQAMWLIPIIGVAHSTFLTGREIAKLVLGDCQGILFDRWFSLMERGNAGRL
jgi:hypothetical protein